ncbi:hypothetical protein CPB83DRAFT_853957 [Crepidotus variabilis]|uniref:Uncharacterized protein n=1 Tax=Crepidotus variabilis TaxID=179855 RepID=A0A9P6EGH2_9AGAR|nr:hypothetical protein CPB83DRAFT_853957 [Crepidotus variabilis]
MSALSNYRMDDTDPDINYFGNWKQGGAASDFRGTTTYPTTEGDYFTVFFHGTKITVFGIMDVNSYGVQAEYSIDGGPVIGITAESVATLKQNFWASTTLSNSVGHFLKVRITTLDHFDSYMNQGTIYFDYFEIENSPVVFNPTAPTSTTKPVAVNTAHSPGTATTTKSSFTPSTAVSSSSSLYTTASVTSIADDEPSSSIQATQVTSSDFPSSGAQAALGTKPRSINRVAVIGGSIAVIVCVFAILLLRELRKRRKIKKNHKITEGTPTTDERPTSLYSSSSGSYPELPTPWLFPQTPLTPQHQLYPSRRSSTPSPINEPTSLAYRLQQGHRSLPPLPYHPLNFSFIGEQVALIPPVPNLCHVRSDLPPLVPLRHQDSGIRLLAGNNILLPEVPPPYNRY